MKAPLRAAAVLLVLALAGCSSAPTGAGSGTGSGTGTSARPVPSTSSPCVSRPPNTSGTPWQPIVTLPAGYVGTRWLASTPGRNDLWLVSAGQTEVTAFHWVSGGGPPTSFTLNTDGAHGLVFGIDAGLAVARDGDVWFGAGHALVRLDPATGSRTYVNVPGATPVQAIESVAADPVDGDVAIAFSDRQRVILYDPASGGFSSFVLPGGPMVASVAYTPDGTLGVETLGGDGAIDMLSPSGRVSTVVAPSDALVAFGGSFLALGTPLEVVSPPTAGSGATVRKVPLPRGLTVPIFAAAAGSPSRLAVAATTRGFLVYHGARSSFGTLTLPTTCVEGLSGPPAATSGAATVQYYAVAVALDAEGDAFFSLNLDQSTIFEIPARLL